MIQKLFGNKNIKSSASIKSAGKVKRGSAATKEDDHWGLGNLSSVDDAPADIWDTAATDALRVPILSKAHSAHTTSEKTTLAAIDNKAQKRKYEILASNPYGVKSLDRESIAATASNDGSYLTSNTPQNISGLGLYTKSPAYAEKMKKLLSGYGLDVGMFGPESTDHLSQINTYSAWIVDVSDEDECIILDNLLDRCNDVPALFFFEQEHSRSSLEKLKTFIETAELN
jgi:hypothetical protein